MLVRLRIFWSMVKRCHLEKALLGFMAAFFLGALIIYTREPGIHNYWDSIWLTFVSCTSIGYGDFVAVTPVGRIVIMCLTIYEILIVALLSGVVVTHYIEVVHRREKYTATVFLDKLEHLRDLSDEEIDDLQERIRKLVLK